MERNCSRQTRYGTQLQPANRYANRKPEPARERNEPATVGTEHNCNRQTSNGTEGTERNRQTRNATVGTEHN